ncbi:MAG: ATP-dependent helicase C-terminal domain-containing protein, partial [Longimicrobiales bacterium]
EAHFADQFVTSRELEWDAETRSVRGALRVQLGAITMREQSFQPDAQEKAAATLTAVRAAGLGILPWGRAAEQLRQRIAFLHTLDGEWPDVSDGALLARLDEWLAPELAGTELPMIDLARSLEHLLSWKQRASIDEVAPTHMNVPSGSRIPIDYTDPAAPALAVRLQEVFGWKETPRIGGDRVPLVMHLLSPAQRPVQATRDLASFWRSGYFDVKKDLKGRYPKHYWPDDPLTATATRRVRPR